MKFGDVIEGVTIEQLDEVTGLSRKSITESKDAELRPRISLKDDARQDPQDPQRRERRPVLPAGRLDHRGQGRRPHRGRRHHRAYPARDDEDQGHHGRSAARRRALRVAQAEGARGHRRDRRHRQLRQGHQGQAQGAVTPEGATPRSTSSPRASTWPSARATESAPASRSWTAPPTRTTSSRCSARRRWPSTWSTRSRRSTDSRASESTTSTSSDRAADAPPHPGHRRGRHRLPRRRARREVRVRGGERAGDGQGRQARPGRAAAARHHQGVALDGELHLGVVVPGDHQGAHRGRSSGQGRLPARPQGERHHGTAHPGRARVWAPTSACPSTSTTRAPRICRPRRWRLPPRPPSPSRWRTSQHRRGFCGIWVLPGIPPPPPPPPPPPFREFRLSSRFTRRRSPLSAPTK